MKIITSGMTGSPKTLSTLTIETNNSSFELSGDDNLLDALIASGHPIEYQCRGGYCGSCRVTVIHGDVDYDDFPLAHLNSDEILPCCCRVTEPLKLDVWRPSDDDNQGELFE